MKAVILPDYNANVLRAMLSLHTNKLPVPVPSTDEVLVKLFAAVGAKVIQMDRVVYGGMTKKELPRGNWRRLNTKEVGFLKMMP